MSHDLRLRLARFGAAARALDSRVDVGAVGLETLGDAPDLLIGKNGRPANRKSDRIAPGERFRLLRPDERSLERGACGQRAVVAEQNRVALVQRLERQLRELLGAGGRVFGAADDRTAEQWDHRMSSRDRFARHGQRRRVGRLECVRTLPAQSRVQGDVAEYSAISVDGKTDLSMVVYNPATPEDMQKISSLIGPIAWRLVEPPALCLNQLVNIPVYFDLFHNLLPHKASTL